MALVGWPDDISIKQEVRCIICAANRSLQNVTAAFVTKEGEQLFVCTGHFWNTSQLIIGLCDYAVRQKQRKQKNFMNMQPDSSDECTVC